MNAPARTYVPNGRDARHIYRSETFEDKGERREAAQEARRLSPQERTDLLYHWGGYEAAVGCRSAMGAIMAVALRAPPRERPTWRLVEEELARKSGKMPADRLERIVAAEGLATRYEVRCAVRGMGLAGRVRTFVEDAPIRDGDDTVRRDSEGTAVQVPTEMVQLLPRPTEPMPERLTSGERWARQDAELELYARGTIRCHDTQSGRPKDVDRDPWLHTGCTESGAGRALARILGRDRAILERVYGSALGRSEAKYLDVFGAELAVVVPYTSVLETVRQALVERTLARQRDAMESDFARRQEEWRQSVSGESYDCLKDLRGLALVQERKRLDCLRKAGAPPRPDLIALAENVEREVTAADAMRAVLDDKPPADQPKAEKRWREDRAEFIRQAKIESERLLAGACAAYRRGLL